jgi:hypothetical protein
VVDEVPCTLKSHQNKAAGDFAVINQSRLTEIQFKGSTEVVEFSS